MIWSSRINPCRALSRSTWNPSWTLLPARANLWTEPVLADRMRVATSNAGPVRVPLPTTSARRSKTFYTVALEEERLVLRQRRLDDVRLTPGERDTVR